MLIVLFVLFVSFIFFVVRKNSFSSCFVGLSFVYMFFFYIYPLSLLYGKDTYSYAGNQFYLSSGVYWYAVISLCVFILGFLSIDLVRTGTAVSRSGQPNMHRNGHADVLDVGSLKYSFSKTFWILLALTCVYYLVEVLDEGRAIRGYDVRRGVSEGSWVSLIFGVLVSAVFSSLLVACVFLKKNLLVILLSILMFLYLFTGATGRAGIIFFFLMVVIYFFKIKVKTIIYCSIPLMLLVLPLVVGMKSIIYTVAVEKSIPDFYNVYSSSLGAEGVLVNFGHPLISFFNIDGLLSLTGYRFFYDYLQGFIFYLRAFGIDADDSLLYYNTENLLGVRESIIPTGYIAFGYVQLALLGVFFSGLFYRGLGIFVEYLYTKLAWDSEVIKFYLVYFAAATFYHGEIRVMVLTFFIPVVLFFIISFRVLKLKEQELY